MLISDPFVDSFHHHRLDFGQQFHRREAVHAKRLRHGESCSHIPAKDGLLRCPQLAAQPSDQVPDLHALEGLGTVYFGWALRARDFAGPAGFVSLEGFASLAVSIAPAEVPVSKGAETFFS